jgi:lysophospholipase L1-like esterase
MHRLRLSATAVAVAIAVIVATAASSSAASDNSVAFVGMGDSYSAGMGTYHYGGFPDNTVCHRSTYSYADAFASHYALPAWLGPTTPTLVACSGATTKAILPFGTETPRQVTTGGPLGINTRLVTLTIGGNDVNFAGLLEQCYGINWPFYDCWTDKLGGVSTSIARLQSVLVDTYTTIQQAAPDAHVVVLTYPDIFPPRVGVNCGQSLGVFGQMSQADLNAIHSAWRHLNDVIKAAAAQAGVLVLDEQNAFVGHDFCSSRPYANGIRNLSLANGNVTVDPESFHPAAAGYALEAADLNTFIESHWP